MESRALDFAALGVLVFVALTFVYVIIYIHDIPYDIAKKRNHPHQDAIHTAGWVSLFLMHTIWPFLWIWATLYKPDRGWGMMPKAEKEATEDALTKMNDLLERISELEKKQASTFTSELSQLESLVQRIEQMEKQLQGQKEA